MKSGMFGSVEDPNYKDAANAIFAVLNFGQYYPNAFVLHPSTVFTISTAKDTTGRDHEPYRRNEWSEVNCWYPYY